MPTTYQTISNESGSSIFIYNRFRLNWSTKNNEMMWLIFIKIHFVYFVWPNKNAVTLFNAPFDWHILKTWIRFFCVCRSISFSSLVRHTESFQLFIYPLPTLSFWFDFEIYLCKWFCDLLHKIFIRQSKCELWIFCRKETFGWNVEIGAHLKSSHE